jgi:hypothetical protein
VVSIPAARSEALRDRPDRQTQGTRQCPHTQLLDCSPVSCFNFDREILSFGIDRGSAGKNPQDYAARVSIDLQPPITFHAS